LFKEEPETYMKVYNYVEKREYWMVGVLKINKKYSALLTAIIMTLALDTTMTFTMTTINSGWTAEFLQRFLKGWTIGFAVALPTSLLVIPLARIILKRLTSE